MLNPNDDTIKAILETATRFAERELKEGVYERDRYPYSDFAAAALDGARQAGLLLLGAPEEAGGVGLPPEVWALVLERVAYHDAGIAASLLAHAAAAQAIIAHGPAKLVKSVLDRAPLLAHPLYLMADDLQGLPAARAVKGGFVLSGLARLVANAPVADAAVIVAEEDDGEPALFLVELDAATRPAPVEVLGLRSCPIGHLDLEDKKLPASHRLARGAGPIADLHLAFLPAAAALSIATLKASLDYALDYGRERYQGGADIIEHSQLRKMYGQMAVEHASLRQSLLASLSTAPSPADRFPLKISAADQSVRATMDGVQLLGGYGYTMEYPQERKMRDARQAAEIFGSPARLRLTLVDRMVAGK